MHPKRSGGFGTCFNSTLACTENSVAGPIKQTGLHLFIILVHPGVFIAVLYDLIVC